MKAMLLDKTAAIEPSPLTLRDLSDTEPAPGEVRLRMDCCAICRTDLHVIEGDLPHAKRPIVPRHQIVRRVDRLGEGCRRLRVGQRVGVAWLRWTCGSGKFCESGPRTSARHRGSPVTMPTEVSPNWPSSRKILLTSCRMYSTTVRRRPCCVPELLVSGR